MLCVTFYNKNTQLRLDHINSFSAPTWPSEPADSTHAIPCFTSIFRGILQVTTMAYHATTGHHGSAVGFPVLKADKAEYFAGSQSTRKHLLTEAD